MLIKLVWLGSATACSSLMLQPWAVSTVSDTASLAITIGGGTGPALGAGEGPAGAGAGGRSTYPSSPSRLYPPQFGSRLLKWSVNEYDDEYYDDVVADNNDERPAAAIAAAASWQRYSAAAPGGAVSTFK